MTPRVLYVVSCAAPPARRIATLIERAKSRGWDDVCLIVTPTAATWVADEVPALEKLTGHPVRSRYKLPTEEDVLPPATAMLACPATFNTLNKWALGISDTLALGLLTEAIGLRLPLVALPYLNEAQAAHPALARSVDLLTASGVRVLLGDGGFEPHPPKHGRLDAYPWDAALDAFPA